MNTTSEEILSLIINLEYLLKNSDSMKFDIKLKVLHIIKNNEKTTPNDIIDKLGMARSNLAIMCNKLIKEGLISKHKDALNKKEIFYTLTTAGLEQLEEAYNKAETNFTKQRNKTKLKKLASELKKLI